MEIFADLHIHRNDQCWKVSATGRSIHLVPCHGSTLVALLSLAGSLRSNIQHYNNFHDRLKNAGLTICLGPMGIGILGANPNPAIRSLLSVTARLKRISQRGRRFLLVSS